jgi:hypothetical protein
MRARVLVTFLEPGRGGRKKPFQGARYSTVARWTRDGHREEWSVVIDFGQPVTGGAELLPGTLTFLAALPERLVRKGSQLELTEGSHTVGEARVEGVVFDAPADADEQETWHGVARFRTDAELRRSRSTSSPRELREGP